MGEIGPQQCEVSD